MTKKKSTYVHFTEPRSERNEKNIVYIHIKKFPYIANAHVPTFTPFMRIYTIKK